MNRFEDIYEKSGVQTISTESGLDGLSKWIRGTFEFNKNHPPLLDLGYFANVVKVTDDLSIAVSTDGVGTKLLVAEMMNKFDTIGIDLIAMCVNDLICIGAEPVTLVDYIAVHKSDNNFLTEISKGLYEGSRIAGISIPGGEVAQLGNMIRGINPDQGFDLVGTGVGLLKNRQPIIGDQVKEGDLIVGLSSSGLHSNGYSLVRKVLFDDAKLDIDEEHSSLGRTLGKELLEPTHIYVKEILEILSISDDIKALINVTGDGIFNIKRIANKSVGFVFENLFKPQPIFDLIQDAGKISNGEMYRIFNMGMGFCIIVDSKTSSLDRISEITQKYGIKSKVVGHIVDDPDNRIQLSGLNLTDIGNRFVED